LKFKLEFLTTFKNDGSGKHHQRHLMTSAGQREEIFNDDCAVVFRPNKVQHNIIWIHGLVLRPKPRLWFHKTEP